MTDEKKVPSKPARPARKPRADKPADAKPAAVPKVAAPAVVEGSSTNAAAVKKSLRDGGMTALPSEILFAVGSIPLVVDKDALSTLAAALVASDDPSTWFVANRELIRAVVFVPQQNNVLRATPLLSVRPVASLSSVHNWQVRNHLSGLHVVVGGTGAGKSKWLNAQTPDVTIRWGEPGETFDMEESSIAVADLTEMLAVALLLATADYRVVIDSFRNLVFGITGAAGPGGVSVALYAALTSLNNICAELGVLLVAAINPMSSDDKVSLVYNNIAASVAGMTVVNNAAVVSQTIRSGTGRIFSGEPAPRNDSPVEYHEPRHTQLDEPSGPSARIRLESNNIDPDDENDNRPRRGARISL
ncbi:packaging NTPase P4 [Pseudomonas phage phi13]|uniref:p4 n=1 Tax=Pseudomonas phage phi13 TaxID=134554 RepID=Q9FZT1_9VIRU|nr:packaging NTPase P4 [Pseudomonas phage phi13]4BLP_A Chain A, Packaging Enzyme P4 [Pseudomonas phage phi13]4BLP_B Chain B, Packaging Enzyme P4 [Pseudomonas phage phi13]4BLP_C Chain C, Packaging Enzyme P4 [Pseudomonas phage phi13]4BLP_D Chain D, Packaging Enzyme P4 [Pseudomonas phage phi13]4BLP_E Chain E, Packaging Enzyme P4 [Pseudomonas phage phi13]4BLP_F Chain F, Packaging Enzyme P4 [Pseudomonas phage phi13]AAG00445.1 P4 [Pseudomonas phage phi13]